jgi:ABC-type phosphate transport system permease subunit
MKKLFIIVTLSIGALVIAIPIGIFAYIKITLYSLENKVPTFSVRVIFKPEIFTV